MPKFKILFLLRANEHLTVIENDQSKKSVLKAVRKTLALMESNLRHPSLNTHEFKFLQGPNNEKIFEAYVQQNSPGAYRIFWYYGPRKGEITIVAIVPHPNKQFN